MSSLQNINLVGSEFLDKLRPEHILKINAWFSEVENKQIHQRHFKNYILAEINNRLLVKNDFVSFDIHNIASSERILLEYVLVMCLSLEPGYDLYSSLTIFWANGDNDFKQLQLSLIHRILQTRRFARVSVKCFWNQGWCILGPEFKKVRESENSDDEEYSDEGWDDAESVYFKHKRDLSKNKLLEFFSSLFLSYFKNQ